MVVAGLVPEMERRGITVLSHGATGRGNDQVRFELAAQMLNPGIRVYAPWRDPAFLEAFGGRREMIEYCRDHGLPVKATLDKPYSTDANILGLTHEAGELESLHTPAALVEPGMGVFPAQAPDEARTVEIRFEAGLPVALDGEALGGFDLMRTANEVAGAHGVGIGLHAVENRFVGLKSRGVYEAPGLELLGCCYEYLLQLVLDRRSRRCYSQVSGWIAEQVYQGYWFDTATRACRAFVDHLSRLATGTIRATLYKGTVQFASADEVPRSLYREEAASMEAVGGLRPSGFHRVPRGPRRQRPDPEPGGPDRALTTPHTASATQTCSPWPGYGRPSKPPPQGDGPETRGLQQPLHLVAEGVAQHQFPPLGAGDLAAGIEGLEVELLPQELIRQVVLPPVADADGLSLAAGELRVHGKPVHRRARRRPPPHHDLQVEGGIELVEGQPAPGLQAVVEAGQGGELVVGREQVLEGAVRQADEPEQSGQIRQLPHVPLSQGDAGGDLRRQGGGPGAGDGQHLGGELDAGDGKARGGHGEQGPAGAAARLQDGPPRTRRPGRGRTRPRRAGRCRSGRNVGPAGRSTRRRRGRGSEQILDDGALLEQLLLRRPDPAAGELAQLQTLHDGDAPPAVGAHREGEHEALVDAVAARGGNRRREELPLRCGSQQAAHVIEGGVGRRGGARQAAGGDHLGAALLHRPDELTLEPAHVADDLGARPAPDPGVLGVRGTGWRSGSPRWPRWSPRRPGPPP